MSHSLGCGPSERQPQTRDQLHTREQLVGMAVVAARTQSRGDCTRARSHCLLPFNMAVRTRESISMKVGVMGPLNTGGPTGVVGDTPSCKLNDPGTYVVQPATVEVGKNTVGGGCVTGGFLNVLTGVFTVSADDRGDAGGIFTGNARVWISTHEGGSQSVGLRIGVGGNRRPGGQITDIEGPPCSGNTDDDTNGASNGPALGTGDPGGGGG